MRPNIIWIYCDELRADVLNCYEGKHTALTPHLDRLASEGTLFSRCYTNSPVCVPSRMAVMTAQYPEDTGIYHNEAHWPDCRFVRPLDQETLPEFFNKAGYVTASFGKSHLPQGMQPFGYYNPAGGDMDSIVRNTLPGTLLTPPGLRTNIGGIYPDDVPFPPDQVTTNGIDWMNNQDSPFFIRFSYLQPHTPVCPPEKLTNVYDEMDLPYKATPCRTSRFEQRFAQILQTDRMTENQIKKSWKCYLALVTWVDKQVGQILDSIKEIENTIIVFDADHGASLAERGCYAKHIFAPPSHRVPRIFSWPGHIPSGMKRPDICESLDLGRTLCSLCRVEPHGSFKGRDLFTEKAPEAVYSTIGFGRSESRAFPNKKYGTYINDSPWPRRACIRTDRYRLDMNIRWNGEAVSQEFEDIYFTDKRKDYDEMRNFANDPDYSSTIADLRNKLLRHCGKNNADNCYWSSST